MVDGRMLAGVNIILSWSMYLKKGGQRILQLTRQGVEAYTHKESEANETADATERVKDVEKRLMLLIEEVEHSGS